MNKLISFNNKHLYIIIILLRIIVGGTFIISGITKMIDPWGFIYEIEQYTSLWNFADYRSITLIFAVSISAIEFILGMSLANGCYKRVSVISLLCIMAFMFPFSIYIAITNPVADCGCFGDFWHISNISTAIKNGILVVLLFYLLFYNTKLRGFFNPYIQWAFAIICVIYILFIGIIGYNIQPLIDFRGFKVNTELIQETNDATEIFVYEKNGIQKEFRSDALPDSSWLFVDRKELNLGQNLTEFIIYDDNDEDVTYDVISTNKNQLLLLIPELKRADISHTYLINELNDYISNLGGELIGIIATNDDGISYWKDISMADYNIYTTDNTIIKELVRGNVAIVYLKNGIIQWKRTINSIDPNILNTTNNISVLDTLYINGTKQFISITSVYVILLMILHMIDRIYISLKFLFSKKNKKNDVTLQKNN